MRSNRSKRAFWFVVGAGVLVMTGTAFACITFYGQQKLTNSLGSSQTVVGDPGAGSMFYCSGEGPQTHTPTAQSGESMTVTVASATTCLSGGANKMPSSGTFNINLNGAAAFTGVTPVLDQTTHGGEGCGNIKFGNTAGNNTINISTIAVDANGAGSRTFTMPSTTFVNGATDSASLCVTTSSYGNISPVHMI